jgi:hypothetical protein
LPAWFITASDGSAFNPVVGEGEAAGAGEVGAGEAAGAGEVDVGEDVGAGEGGVVGAGLLAYATVDNPAPPVASPTAKTSAVATPKPVREMKRIEKSPQTVLTLGRAVSNAYVTEGLNVSH